MRNQSPAVVEVASFDVSEPARKRHKKAAIANS